MTTDPIRRIKDVQAIKKLISGTPSDLLLFTMGINNGLRCGDLLKLEVKDVKHLRPGDSITIKEGKTAKNNILMVNKAVYKSFKGYRETVKPDDEQYLFKSKKGKGKPLTVQAVNALIKKWCRTISLHGNYGAHTLRKTFGYIQRTQYGVGLSYSSVSKRAGIVRKRLGEEKRFKR